MNAVPEPKRAIDYRTEIVEELIPVTQPLNKLSLTLSLVTILAGALLLFWSADRDPNTWAMHSPLGWWLAWIPILGGSAWLIATVERYARG